MINLRDISYNLLYDVKYNKKYSNIVINQYFKNLNLNYEQKGFITYIVYGVLSNINYLDYFIKKYSDIGFSKISKKARVILEIAFFELIFMTSSCDYASVNEAVKLSKKYDNRAKGFINAILRKFTSDEINVQNAKKYDFSEIEDINQFIQTKYSVSKYIADRLLSNYDKDFVCNLLSSMSKTPKLFIRANRLKTDFADFKSKLDDMNIDYETVDEKNSIFSLKNFKDISENELFKQGLFSIQDYASMLCVLTLSPKMGEKVLDICSAPGGKSIFMAELMNNSGSITSLDISSSKLKLLEGQTKRLGIDIINTGVNDASINKKEYEGIFDKIVCDVPCSGIGIIRRKPEIRYKEFEDINQLIDIQKTILQNSSMYLKINGSIVYSTCTLGKEENFDIVDDFLKRNKNFELISQKEYFPNIDDTDGFFVAMMKKLY